MANLGQQHRRRDLSQTVSEPQQDPAAHEEAHAFRESLEEGANNHDDAADDDGQLPAVVVGEKGSADRC